MSLRSARGIVCWTGWVSPALVIPTRLQAHDDESAHGSTLCLLGRYYYLVSLPWRLMPKLFPNDPEMWLELEPIYTDALHNCRSSQIPSGIELGVALRCLGLSSHALDVNVGASSLLVVMVPRLGGAPKLFTIMRSAKGVM